MKLALRISFSLVFTLILLEILLRFVWLFPATAKGAYLCRDAVADHSHYPYGKGRMRTQEFDVVLTMNNVGMRDDDVAAEKAPGTRRLLVLGDSFMEGWGCQRGEIFTDLLESELTREGRTVEVVAAGVASWSPLTELAWLRHRGLALSPDVVLVAVDATDPAGDSFYQHRLVRDEQGRPDHIRPGRRLMDLPQGLHNLLARRSWMYRYIDRWLTKTFPASEWDYGYWSESDDVWAPLRSETEIPAARYEAYWKPTREALQTMREILDERGIPLLVVMYPAGVETDTEAWEPGRATADFPHGVVPPRRFEYLEAATAADSVPYFSLLETFRSDERPARLFYPYDGHWSPAGHRAAAAAVAGEIRRRGLLGD